MLAPIILFAFVRLDTLMQTVSSLKNNFLAEESDLFIYIDGPKNDVQRELQKPIISYLNDLCGFKTITIKTSEHNKGLDPSIIDGVTEVINQYGKAIVLEDDVVTSRNFLCYMNKALDVYESNKTVMSISGFSMVVKKPSTYDSDVYLFGRSASWGWATWVDRWSEIDWEIRDWNSFRHNLREIRAFNKRGGSDMFKMLSQCMNGGNMWDIRFCYNMYKKKKYSVVPFISKTKNIGFNDLAEHCKPIKYNRLKSNFDYSDITEFVLPYDIEPNKTIIKSRLLYQSYLMRLYSKIRNLF